MSEERLEKLEAHYRKLENAYVAAPVNAFYEPSMTVGEGEAVIRQAVRERHFHIAGAVHGSVYFKLLDDAAFFAVNSLVRDVFVLTASFNIYFMRPVNEGTLRAEGRVVSRSTRLFIAESELYDDRDRVIGRGSGTFMTSSIPLGPEIGYTL